MNESHINQITVVLKKYMSNSDITDMIKNLGIKDSYSASDGKDKRIREAIRLSSLTTVIEYVFSPIKYVGKQDVFKSSIKDVNTYLAFLGLQVLHDGKVVSITPATTLEEADYIVSRLKKDLEIFDVHQKILDACKPEIVSQNLFHLVFEACKVLLNQLRSISGLSFDGNELVNQCFQGKNPLLTLNALQDDNDWSEHRGIHSLLNSIVYLYRNPKAHKPKYFSSDTYKSTLEALIVISRAFHAVDKCTRNKEI